MLHQLALEECHIFAFITLFKRRIVEDEEILVRRLGRGNRGILGRIGHVFEVSIECPLVCHDITDHNSGLCACRFDDFAVTDIQTDMRMIPGDLSCENSHTRKDRLLQRISELAFILCAIALIDIGADVRHRQAKLFVCPNKKAGAIQDIVSDPLAAVCGSAIIVIILGISILLPIVSILADHVLDFLILPCLCP